MRRVKSPVFITTCMDPLVNQAAKVRYVFGDQARRVQGAAGESR